jgi:hypothetical protein
VQQIDISGLLDIDLIQRLTSENVFQPASLTPIVVRPVIPKKNCRQSRDVLWEGRSQNLNRRMKMDQETQQRRTLNLVKTVLKRALALPSEEREALINVEMQSFRNTAGDLYQANPEAKAAALILADKMHGCISAMVKMLELSGEKAESA